MKLPLTRPRQLGARRVQRVVRAPVVIRVAGGAVVGVGHTAQPRFGCGAGPDVLDVLGVAARAGGEEGRGRHPVVLDDLPARRRDRRVALRGLGGHAPVHLRARVRIERVAVARHAGRDRVGARRHRLGLQGRRRPAGRHLGRDHPAHVVIETERVDGLHTAGAVGTELERTAVAAQARHEQRPRPGDPQRGGEPAELVALGPDQDERAVGLGHHAIGEAGLQLLGARPGGPGEGGAAGAEQDPYGLGGVDVSQRGVTVVVVQDEAVILAVQRVAVGPVLAHADPVAKATAANEQHAGGAGARGAGQDPDQAGKKQQTAHHLALDTVGRPRLRLDTGLTWQNAKLPKSSSSASKPRA